MKKPQPRFSPKTRAALRGGYFALSVVDTLLAARTERSKWRRVSKPLLMPTLIASISQPPTNTLNASTYVGLAASGVGDVLLLDRSQTSFLKAMGSFSLAHIAFTLGVLPLRDRATPWTRWPGTKTAAAALATASPIAALAARKQPALGPAVAGYAVLLAGHSLAAAAIDTKKLAERNRRDRIVGANLFLLSDALLGLATFALQQRRPLVEGSVMASYTAAQWFIAESARHR